MSGIFSADGRSYFVSGPVSISHLLSNCRGWMQDITQKPHLTSTFVCFVYLVLSSHWFRNWMFHKPSTCWRSWHYSTLIFIICSCRINTTTDRPDYARWVRMLEMNPYLIAVRLIRCSSVPCSDQFGFNELENFIKQGEISRLTAVPCGQVTHVQVSSHTPVHDTSECSQAAAHGRIVPDPLHHLSQPLCQHTWWVGVALHHRRKLNTAALWKMFQGFVHQKNDIYIQYKRYNHSYIIFYFSITHGNRSLLALAILIQTDRAQQAYHAVTDKWPAKCHSSSNVQSETIWFAK